MLERGDAAADLARVFHRHAGLLVDLVAQQVGQWTGGWGGSAAGTKARKRSPAVATST